MVVLRKFIKLLSQFLLNEETLITFLIIILSSWGRELDRRGWNELVELVYPGEGSDRDPA